MEKNTKEINSLNNHKLYSLSKSLNKPIDNITNLHILWKNEKFCKDLLPYDEEFVSQIVDIVEQKEKEIQNAKYDKEMINILELDVQRVKFCIKDYFRIRLCKIEKYLFYILKNDLSNLLSQNEIKYAVDLINMKSVYLNEGLKKLNVFVNNFRPFLDKFKTMSDKVMSLNDAMIVSPPKSAYVIIESVANENLIINVKEIFENYEHEYLVLEKGDTAVVPYETVKDLIKFNKVKLI